METRHKKTLGAEGSSEMTSIFEELKTQITKNNEATMKKLAEIEDSQNFLCSKYDEIIKRLDKISELEVRLKKVEAQNDEKSKQIIELSSRLARSEQYSRKNMLEICNVAHSPDEKPVDLVIKIASKAGVALEPNDIQAAHRLGKVIQGKKIPNIIVELSSRPKRDFWLSQRKKTVLNSEVTGCNHGRIFINESLSPYFKDLNYKVRSITKQSANKYFVWYKDYSIFVRQDLPNATPLKIQSEKDLPNITKNILEKTGM